MLSFLIWGFIKLFGKILIAILAIQKNAFFTVITRITSLYGTSRSRLLSLRGISVQEKM